MHASLNASGSRALIVLAWVALLTIAAITLIERELAT
jgi:hypothetical protein